MNSETNPEINDYVNDVLRKTNEHVIQNCSVNVLNIHDITIDATGNINISNLDMNNLIHVDTLCVQNINNQTIQLEDINNKYANSIIQKYAIHDNAIQQQIHTLVHDFGTNVLNIYKQNCGNNIYNQSNIEIKREGNVSINYITQQSFIQSVLQCVMDQSKKNITNFLEKINNLVQPKHIDNSTPQIKNDQENDTSNSYLTIVFIIALCFVCGIINYVTYLFVAKNLFFLIYFLEFVVIIIFIFFLFFNPYHHSTPFTEKPSVRYSAIILTIVQVLFFGFCMYQRQTVPKNL
jgi:hypothetical protein